MGAPVVDNCLSGYNSSVFAYGQTGAGKTFTMMGRIGGEGAAREQVHGSIVICACSAGAGGGQQDLNLKRGALAARARRASRREAAAAAPMGLDSCEHHAVDLYSSIVPPFSLFRSAASRRVFLSTSLSASRRCRTSRCGRQLPTDSQRAAQQAASRRIAALHGALACGGQQAAL